MKSLIKFILIYSMNCCLYSAAMAQTSETQESTNNKNEIIFPPLTDLIDSAVKHNAFIRFRHFEIDAKASNLKTQRNYWLRNLGIQADTRYGTYDNFSSNANGQSTTLLNTTSRQFNYGVGLYIKLPVFDVVNRKTQISQAKAELEQAKSMAEVQQDELRLLVIRQYHELLLKQKILILKSQNLGSATVNMEMVEKEFRNGVIPITEYVRISDMTSRIMTDYENAKSEFMLSRKILEDIAGFTFSKTYSK